LGAQWTTGWLSMQQAVHNKGCLPEQQLDEQVNIAAAKCTVTVCAKMNTL
jgi:hypothetical protein